MKEKLKQYFKTEKFYVNIALLHQDDVKQRNEICYAARQRALGAIDIAQLCGLDYDTAEKMFYNYCDEMESMEYDSRH